MVTPLENYKILVGQLADKDYAWGQRWRQNVEPFFKTAGFFTAPASSHYHLCCPGGLLEHSVSVTMTALELLTTLGDKGIINPCEVIMAGLLHDAGKLGVWDFGKDGLFCARTGVPRYSVNEKFDSSKPVSKDNSPYTVNEPRPFISLTDLGAFYAASLQMPWNVIQAVKLADGFYVPENDPYKNRIEPLSYLIKMADEWRGLVTEQTPRRK